MVRFLPPAGAMQRSLRVNNKLTATSFRDKEAVVATRKMESSVLESLNPDTRPGDLGTAVRLTIGPSKYVIERPNRPSVAPSAEEYTRLSQYSPTFLVDKVHSVKERGLRNFQILRRGCAITSKECTR